MENYKRKVESAEAILKREMSVSNMIDLLNKHEINNFLSGDRRREIRRVLALYLDNRATELKDMMDNNDNYLVEITVSNMIKIFSRQEIFNYLSVGRCREIREILSVYLDKSAKELEISGNLIETGNVIRY